MRGALFGFNQNQSRELLRWFIGEIINFIDNVFHNLFRQLVSRGGHFLPF